MLYQTRSLRAAKAAQLAHPAQVEIHAFIKTRAGR